MKLFHITEDSIITRIR